MKRALLRLCVILGLVGSTATHAITAAINASPATTSWLSNISTRAFVETGDNVMIGGFIVQGAQTKKVIILAIGPSLIPFGITEPLADPTLELHDVTGALIASND